MLKLAIFSEAGFNYGFGHFYRMEGVCEKALSCGRDAKLYLMADEAAKDNLRRSYVEFVDWKSTDEYNRILDLNTTLVVDSYHVDIKDLEEFQAIARDMIVIDDNVRLDYHDMKILNPNYYAAGLEYPDKGNTVFEGKDYTLLRDEFSPSSERPVKEVATDVLVTMGGTDPTNRTPGIINMIKNVSKNATVHVVCTKAYSNLEEIKRMIDCHDRLYLNITAAGMSKLMNKCDFAVASAGQTTNELIKMQCPAVLVVVVDNQVNSTKYLTSNGYIESMYEDDIAVIRKMFMYERRGELYDRLQSFASDKSGKDLIYEIAFSGGSNE